MSEILTGDCVELMATLEAESVDAIVTDPPYGLEFMGKEWDAIGTNGRDDLRHRRRMTKASEPEKGNPWASERPSHGTVRKNPRCRNCQRLRFDHEPRRCQCPEPSWDLRITESARVMQDWHQRWATEAFRVAKPGAHLLAFGGTRTYHRLASAIEDAGWEIRDCLVWAYASGFPKSLNFPDGTGTALKPAWEPIVMARRPLIGTVAANRERHGTGALNIDATRIGTNGEEIHVPQSDPTKRGGTVGTDLGISRASVEDFQTAQRESIERTNTLGRWPANLILTDPIFDGSVDGVVGGGEAGGHGVGDLGRTYERDGRGFGSVTEARRPFDLGDTGTYSRFFLIPKAARSDREPVLRGGTERVISVWGGEEDDLTPGKKSTIPRANSHPTVKPVELMRHLVRLVTPPGGTVLDCFLGSGTTAIACELEGFAWIGMEKEPEYVAIAEARLNGTQRGIPWG